MHPVIYNRRSPTSPAANANKTLAHVTQTTRPRRWPGGFLGYPAGQKKVPQREANLPARACVASNGLHPYYALAFGVF